MVLMICYARSGGTLLNRCLGALPGVVILSEVHPLGGGTGAPGTPALTTVRDQAAAWYGITLQSEDFVENLVEIENHCDRRGLHLVMREWSFLNFTPCPENDHRPPNRLVTLEALRERCLVRPFAFVRDAIDVWLSRSVPLEEFAEPYRRYVQALVDSQVPIFRYEDFCRDPDNQMRHLCDACELPFSGAYRQYEQFTHVNGDVQGPSRGRKQGGFAILPRRRIGPAQRARLRACAAIRRANELLGYPVDYAARPREGYVPYLRRTVGRVFHRGRPIIRPVTSTHLEPEAS
ncbi:MAG TPA: hypothetical protein ENN87_17560 [Phycisphaerales bacterium]|nr:hypothetical protein [Phycisphaerales bacterium]